MEWSTIYTILHFILTHQKICIWLKDKNKINVVVLTLFLQPTIGNYCCELERTFLTLNVQSVQRSAPTLTHTFCISGTDLLCSIVFYSSKHLKGQLGPRVSSLTFLIKGGQLGCCVGDITFFNQRRSVGALCWWRHVFAPNEVSCGPALGPQLGPTEGYICLFITFHPHHQFLKGCVCLFVCLSVCNVYPCHQFLIGCSCLFVMFYPHHQFNRAQHRRREARCWKHPKTVFWPDDPV